MGYPQRLAQAGTLSSDTVSELAKRYKAWLYLNPKGLSLSAGGG